MKKTQTAWAIQRPDKVIVTNMIRATRLGAINAFQEHLSRDYKPTPWQTAHRNGFRVVKVTVSAAHINEAMQEQQA
jgi:hypothetical protein